MVAQSVGNISRGMWNFATKTYLKLVTFHTIKKIRDYSTKKIVWIKTIDKLISNTKKNVFWFYSLILRLTIDFLFYFSLQRVQIMRRKKLFCFSSAARVQNDPEGMC